MRVSAAGEHGKRQSMMLARKRNERA